MGNPLATQIANWVTDLDYGKLQSSIVDKVKALFLHGLCGMSIGLRHSKAQEVIRYLLDEESVVHGCSIPGFSAKATRVAAAFSMSELIHVSGLWDSYRMLTHPGAVLIPVALLTAEKERSSGEEIIAALAAGYEVACRLCDDFIPSTAARGFRPSPIFATLAGAVVAGKLMRLNEKQLLNAIALAANFASGLNEGPRRGTGEMGIHEPQAARNAVFSAMMARHGHIDCADTTLEGAAGFYNAFTGSSAGDLSYSFKNIDKVDMNSLLENLGDTYKLQTIMFRIYACPGYNQGVIELFSMLHHQFDLGSKGIEKIEVRMNWLETRYPSPKFPLYDDWNTPRKTETHYFAAYAALHGSYPMASEVSDVRVREKVANDACALALMERVSLIPERDREMFSPAARVVLASGETIEESFPYSRMEWGFDELVMRLERGFQGRDQAAFERMVESSRTLDELTSVDGLFQLFQDGN